MLWFDQLAKVKKCNIYKCPFCQVKEVRISKKKKNKSSTCKGVKSMAIIVFP